MGRITLFIGFIIAVVFLYYLLTNSTFMGFVTSALNFGTAAVQSGAVGQLVNLTKGMNESAFLGWANSANNTNPIIGQIKSTSGNASLQSNLKDLWSSIQNTGGSGTFNSLVGKINNIISGAKS